MSLAAVRVLKAPPTRITDGPSPDRSNTILVPSIDVTSPVVASLTRHPRRPEGCSG